MSEPTNEFATGWRALIGCFLGIALGVSSLYFYSIGIFIIPLSEEFGWSRGEASLGALVGTICAAIVSMPVGRMVDRYGAVRVGLVSLLLLALSLAGMGLFTTGLTSFLILVAVLSLLVVGSTPISFSRLIITHFDRHRGLALGLVLAGTGLGAILVPRTLTPFVAEHGWRNGYIALAATIAILLPIIWLAFRGQESQPTQASADHHPIGAVLLSPAFIAIGAIFLVASVSLFGTVIHFVPMLTGLGLSPAETGQTASLIGVAAIAGRLIAGFLLDRLPATLVTAGLFILTASGFTMLATGGTEVVALGALTVGLAIGAEVDLMTYITSRFFPRKIFGETYGSLYALFLLGGAIGPPVYGYLFDATGDYRAALLTGAGFLAIAAIGSGMLGMIRPVEIESPSPA